MDSKGFIKDPTIRIVPSKTFEEFLDKLKIVKTMPESLQNHLYNIVDKKTEQNSQQDKKNDSLITKEDLKVIKSLIKDESIKEDSRDLRIEEKESNTDSVNKSYSKKYPDNVRCLRICDLEWIMTHLNKTRSEEGEDCPYLHELLEGSEIIVPENEVIKRNPELEARCVKLRKDQDNKFYRNMTKDVDNVRRRLPEDTIAYQLKAINSQLVAVLQFIFSVFAGFMFGFIGIEVFTGSLDFGFRLLLGVMCGLIVALAEIYFLAKKLNEDMAMEDNVQIGGPPVVPGMKLHQD